eukprot:SAG11_NODE_191_length_12943_cov_3.853706_11_plen_188_part_00
MPADDGSCIELNLNDFSSAEAMELAGWSIGVNTAVFALSTLTPDLQALSDITDVRPSSWIGCASPSCRAEWWTHGVVGSLSIVLPATGAGTVDFGNCFHSCGMDEEHEDRGMVYLMINGKELASASPDQHSSVTTITFDAGDTLSLKTGDAGSTGIILNSVNLNCTVASGAWLATVACLCLRQNYCL